MRTPVGVHVGAVSPNGRSLVSGFVPGPQLPCFVPARLSRDGDQCSRSWTAPGSGPGPGQTPIKPVRYEMPPYLGQGL